MLLTAEYAFNSLTGQAGVCAFWLRVFTLGRWSPVLSNCCSIKLWERGKRKCTCAYTLSRKLFSKEISHHAVNTIWETIYFKRGVVNGVFDQIHLGKDFHSFVVGFTCLYTHINLTVSAPWTVGQHSGSFTAEWHDLQHRAVKYFCFLELKSLSHWNRKSLNEWLDSNFFLLWYPNF